MIQSEGGHMSKRILFAVFPILVLSSLSGFAQGIAWRANLDSAVAEAKRSGKLMMVDVYTDWCGWCKKLDSETYTNATVIAKSAGFVPLKINPEKDADAARFVGAYGVNGYPTILFVEADGTLANKIVGYLDASSLLDAMSKTTAYTPKVKAQLAEFKSGTYGNARELLSMLVELGRIEDAKMVFDRLRAANTLERSLQESVALSIAQKLLDDDVYDGALTYLKIIEDLNSGSDNTRDAHLMHSMVIFYSKGKSAGMEYLDVLLRNPSTPAAWKSRLENLKNQMKAAKDPAGS
jgi:thiol-disulfide isomerase/thioredoxin